MLLGLLLGAQLAGATELTYEDALALGECGRIVTQAPATDAERLAHARCQTRAGHPEVALVLLAPLKGGVLDAYARFFEAEALLARGSASSAADALAEAKLPAAVEEGAALLRGRALVEGGRYLEARDVIRPLLTAERAEPGYQADVDEVDPAEVRWWLAEGAHRRGETDAAVPVWQALWSRNPTSPRAEDAAARLAAAGQPVPDTATEAGRALVGTRIRSLEKRSLFPEALALRDLLPEDSTRTMARASFKAKDYPRAVALWSKSSNLTIEERFDHALAASRAGDYAAAARMYSAVMQSDPTHNRADQASFKLGYLAYDDGDLSRAIGLFRDHLARYPRSSAADAARWCIGWSLSRLEKWREADAAMAEVLALHPTSGLAPAAAYWQARMADQRGDASAAKEGYGDVLDRWPQSGYAWFAADRLGREVEPRAAVPAPAPTDVLQGAAWQRAEALIAAGLDGWARAELSPLMARARKAGRDSALALAHALVRAGAYTDAQTLSRAYCTRPWDTADAVAAQACWPRPAAGLVARLTRTSGVDPNLPFGIMVAESAMKPWVTSPVGAAGLMQLMPSLAATLHSKLYFQSEFSPETLYRPAYNAALGVTELGELQARFGASATPSLPLVIAGYNGGADAVARWLEGYPVPPDGDRFAEDISYSETRRYVRRVLGNLQTWRYVYGDG